jgi:hypothetical protein
MKIVKKKLKKKYIVNYCYNTRIWMWGNSNFPTPFSFIYNILLEDLLKN